jgi:hypothetical protein
MERDASASSSRPEAVRHNVIAVVRHQQLGHETDSGHGPGLRTTRLIADPAEAPQLKRLVERMRNLVTKLESTAAGSIDPRCPSAEAQVNMVFRGLQALVEERNQGTRRTGWDDHDADFGGNDYFDDAAGDTAAGDTAAAEKEDKKARKRQKAIDVLRAFAAACPAMAANAARRIGAQHRAMHRQPPPLCDDCNAVAAAITYSGDGCCLSTGAPRRLCPACDERMHCYALREHARHLHVAALDQRAPGVYLPPLTHDGSEVCTEDPTAAEPGSSGIPPSVHVGVPAGGTESSDEDMGAEPSTSGAGNDGEGSASQTRTESSRDGSGSGSGIPITSSAGIAGGSATGTPDEVPPGPVQQLGGERSMYKLGPNDFVHSSETSPQLVQRTYSEAHRHCWPSTYAGRVHCSDQPRARALTTYAVLHSTPPPLMQATYCCRCYRPEPAQATAAVPTIGCRPARCGANRCGGRGVVQGRSTVHGRCQVQELQPHGSDGLAHWPGPGCFLPRDRD